MKLKTLILKIIILTSLLIVTYIGAVYNIVQGPVDSYYSKFTHKSGSLVVGLSRAIFGVVPSVIEEELGDKINKPVLNFAFDRIQSPYGNVLLNGIKRKIDTTSNNGLFILSVSPASFFISKTIKDNGISDLDEQLGMDKMSDLNSHPNYQYIRRYYSEPLYKGFYNAKSKIKKPHPDGWLEFQSTLGDSYSVTENQVKFWSEQTYTGYKIVAKNGMKSKYRIAKFIETINFLENYGTVLLVRLPIDKEVIELENSLWPTFNNEMKLIANQNQAKYVNYTVTEKKYKTFDGSHLFGSSAKEFTKTLCDDIKTLQLLDH